LRILLFLTFLFCSFFFFFSSRRRHTRFSRDWSSDVCSSDLLFSIFQMNSQTVKPNDPLAHTYSIVARDAKTGEMAVAVQSHWFRSEERRVGKECGGWCGPDELEESRRGSSGKGTRVEE